MADRDHLEVVVVSSRARVPRQCLVEVLLLPVDGVVRVLVNHVA